MQIVSIPEQWQKSERQSHQPDQHERAAGWSVPQKLSSQERASHRTGAPGKIQQSEGRSHALGIPPSGEHIGRRHGQSEAESINAKGRQRSLLQQKDGERSAAYEAIAAGQGLPKITPDQQG